jgi:8-oxo-dGTP pyrophosphatase MutT (NUDIX family)
VIYKWKFISRKLLLDHPRLKIVEDVVELPNSQQIKYIRESPAGHRSVAVIAVNKNNQILIQTEYSYPPNEVLYQLPGGSVNQDEDIIVAANRELSEESGYVGSDCKFIGFFYTNNRRSDNRQYVVVCKNLKKQKLPQDNEEFIESEWIDPDKIKELIIAGKITNMNLLAAIQLYATVDL